MASRINEVRRGRMPLNHQRAVDAAGCSIFLLCVFILRLIIWPADFLNERIAQADILTVGDLMDMLMEIPEYIEARRLKRDR
jgi:hypothetical protein